jgi:hypothetical protein
LKLLRRGDDKYKSVSVKELALALPTRAWRTIMAGTHPAEVILARP